MKTRFQRCRRGRSAISVQLGRRLRQIAILPALCGLLALVACAGNDADEDGWIRLAPDPASEETVLHIIGTVRFLDVEGGRYVIVDSVNDTRFDPTNLPGEFQHDGIPVEAFADRLEKTVSIGMVAPQVDLIRIRHLPVP
jgi:hypothetical protein